MTPELRWLSRRYFRRLADRELLEPTPAFVRSEPNISNARREVRRRAARSGLSVKEWIRRLP